MAYKPEMKMAARMKAVAMVQSRTSVDSDKALGQKVRTRSSERYNYEDGDGIENRVHEQHHDFSGLLVNDLDIV